MRDFILKNWYWIAAILVVGIACFFMGRANTETITKTEYIKSKPIQGTITTPEPVSSTIPDNYKLPTKKEIVYPENKKVKTKIVKGETEYIDVPYYISEKVDTSKIISEYITENKYSNQLFDNDNGKLVVNSNVQYNKLQKLDYSFTPVQKVVTKERKRTFTPFITGSYNTFNHAAAGGGIYIKNIGIGAKYVRDITNNKGGYEGGVYIKF